MPVDVFPREAVASVVGLGGMGGAVGGLLASPGDRLLAGLVQWRLRPLFVFAGILYLIALGIIHLLVPDLDKSTH